MKRLSLALAACLCATPVLAHHPYDLKVNSGPGRVIDGDTIIYGRSRVRAVGYDTPEKGGLAKCDSERALADKATARFRELSSAPHVFTLKWAKGKDKYGRSLALFYSDHKEIGQILISEGLAHPYDGARRSSWCQ